jgi:hypothetical protein
MSYPNQGIIVFATVLLITSTPLIITAINGYSYYTSAMIVSAWAKGTGYNLIDVPNVQGIILFYCNNFCLF